MANHRGGTIDDCAQPAPRLRLLALLSSAPIGSNNLKEEYDKRHRDPIPLPSVCIDLKRLNEQGLVKIHRPNGRHVYLYSITDAGKKALQEGREYYLETANFGL